MVWHENKHTDNTEQSAEKQTCFWAQIFDPQRKGGTEKQQERTILETYSYLTPHRQNHFKRIIDLNIKGIIIIRKFLRVNMGEWDFRNSGIESSADHLSNETTI